MDTPLIRRRIVDLLGKTCSRCGLADPIVLQIDHVNGGGSKERSRFKSTRSYLFFVLKKVKNGSRDYQLLCANCNVRKEYLNRGIAHEVKEMQA